MIYFIRQMRCATPTATIHPFWLSHFVCVCVSVCKQKHTHTHTQMTCICIFHMLTTAPFTLPKHMQHVWFNQAFRHCRVISWWREQLLPCRPAQNGLRSALVIILPDHQRGSLSPFLSSPLRSSPPLLSSSPALIPLNMLYQSWASQLLSHIPVINAE